jgi:hypothetical protein
MCFSHQSETLEHGTRVSSLISIMVSLSQEAIKTKIVAKQFEEKQSAPSREGTRRPLVGSADSIAIAPPLAFSVGVPHT